MARRLSSLVVISLTIFFLYLNWDWLMDELSRASSAPLERAQASPQIPRKLWQTALNSSTSEVESEVSAQWRTLNPGYAFDRLSATESDVEVQSHFHHPFGKVYDSLRDPALRASLLRYLVLLVEGGASFNIDMLTDQPIANWMPDGHHDDVGLVVALSDDGPESDVRFSTSIIIARASHVVVGDMIAAMALCIRTALETRNLVLSEQDESALIVQTGSELFTSKVLKYLCAVVGKDGLEGKLRRLHEPTLMGDVLVLPRGSFHEATNHQATDHAQEPGRFQVFAHHVVAGADSELELLRIRRNLP